MSPTPVAPEGIFWPDQAVGEAEPAYGPEVAGREPGGVVLTLASHCWQVQTRRRIRTAVSATGVILLKAAANVKVSTALPVQSPPGVVEVSGSVAWLLRGRRVRRGLGRRRIRGWRICGRRIRGRGLDRLFRGRLARRRVTRLLVRRRPVGRRRGLCGSRLLCRVARPSRAAASRATARVVLATLAGAALKGPVRAGPAPRSELLRLLRRGRREAR
jgi:hypothetical protein